MVVLTGLLLGVMLEHAEMTEADSETIFEQWCFSQSFVPEEEVYVHIAGGFFSVFEGRVGSIYQGKKDLLSEWQDYSSYCSERRHCGSICMKLKKLRYSSRFVYLPEGEIVLQGEDAQKVSFTMQKLDYVLSGDDDSVYYRIHCLPSVDCEPGLNSAYLICFATENPTPVLFGFFCLLSDTGIEKSFAVRIGGRNENRADNHLQKVIVRATEL